MAESYRFHVSGRVQGVFFRQSTAEKARALGLDGWVRNLPDGRVEGLVHGEAQALTTFRDWLDRGPPAARVKSVDWQVDTEVPAPDFVVRP